MAILRVSKDEFESKRAFRDRLGLMFSWAERELGLRINRTPALEYHYGLKIFVYYVEAPPKYNLAKDELIMLEAYELTRDAFIVRVLDGGNKPIGE